MIMKFCMVILGLMQVFNEILMVGVKEVIYYCLL